MADADKHDFRGFLYPIVINLVTLPRSNEIGSSVPL